MKVAVHTVALGTPRPYVRDGIFRGLAQTIEFFFVRHRSRIALVHMGMFVAFVALLFVPLFLDHPPEHATPFGNFTKFANYSIWAVWFPLVFLSVIDSYV